jgi:O-antigen/teichoic acid export membrane protein
VSSRGEDYPVNPEQTSGEAPTLHELASQGIKLMLGRQALILGFTFGTGIVLARLLGPAQFGVYAIATFFVEVFALFGNFGLAASFIQRREEPTEHDLRVGFTLQQALISVVAALLFVTAPWLVAAFPKAPDNADWLVRALAVTLFLTSWRSMSALQLERRLQYGRVAWIEVTETVAYQSTAVGAAVAGYGVWSLVAAALVRGVLGTALLYAAAPWPVRLAFDRGVAREILRFGIPFQLQNLVNQVGGWTTPLIVGTLVGPRGVGLLTFASSNARKPLLLVDNVMRVAFPHFSRLQDDRDEVERVLRRYLTYLLLPASLWCAVLVVAGSSLIEAIYGPKWKGAALPLALFAVALLFDVLHWMVGVTLNSIGLVRATTRVVVAKSLLQLVLGVPLILAIGLNGVPLAYLATALAVTPWFLLALGRRQAGRTVRDLRWLAIPLVGAIAVASPLLVPSLQAGLRAALLTVTICTAFLAFASRLRPSWLRTGVEPIMSTRRRPEPTQGQPLS